MSDVVGETQQAYDKIAPLYKRMKADPWPEGLSDIAWHVERLPQGAVVADIGCGPGKEIGLLRENGLTAFGFDYSAGQLRTGGVAGVAQADMRRLPIGTATVDVVWCQAALLHIPSSDVPAVLGEFARIVRPGGRFFLVVAEGDGERWEQLRETYGGEGRRWFTYHQEPALTAQLDAVGFTVDRVVRAPSNRDWLKLYAVRS